MSNRQRPKPGRPRNLPIPAVDVAALPAPPAVIYGNYDGDQRTAVGQVMGPRLDGYMITAVQADYDLKLDRTRIGFTYGDHADRFTTSEGAA